MTARESALRLSDFRLTPLRLPPLLRDFEIYDNPSFESKRSAVTPINPWTLTGSLPWEEPYLPTIRGFTTELELTSYCNCALTFGSSAVATLNFLLLARRSFSYFTPGRLNSPLAIPPYAPAMFFSLVVGSRSSIVVSFGFLFFLLLFMTGI